MAGDIACGRRWSTVWRCRTHYALLVSDDVFDHALEQIETDGVAFWAGPGHTPGEINTNHGGRGVYFDDPSGHHFELITKAYGADLP